MAHMTVRKHAGQATLEFALTSLLLMALIFGTIDLGRAVFARTMLTNAVREAARQGSIEISNKTANASTVKSVIATAANNRSPSLTFTASSFTLDCTTWPTATSPPDGFYRNCDPNAATAPVQVQDRVKVCADYPFSFIAGNLIGRSTITFHECEQTSVQ